MAIIRPFKATRPVRDKAHMVVTRPFYTYKKNVLKAKLESNPYSFLHIINPEFDKKHKSEPNSKERFKAVKEKYEHFCKENYLIEEKQEALYLYRQSKKDYDFTGIITAASVDDYLNNVIKKHEETLTSRVEVFSSYLNIVEFNAEPVLLSYPKNEEISLFYNRYMENRSEYEFTTADQVKHEVWLIDSKADIDFLTKKFRTISSLYIADGHHRCSSSAHHAQFLRSQGKSKEETDDLLAYIIDDEQLKIWEFNRLVKDLGKHDIPSFLKALEKTYDIKELSSAEKPKQKFNFTLYLNKKWYSLKLKENCKKFKNAASKIDAQVLTDTILSPLLNIRDLKTDERINFISGEEGLAGIKKSVDKGTYQVGFCLYPVSFEEIKIISDLGLSMPPKSTWIEPKLRSGLTILKV